MVELEFAFVALMEDECVRKISSKTAGSENEQRRGTICVQSPWGT